MNRALFTLTRSARLAGMAFLTLAGFSPLPARADGTNVHVSIAVSNGPARRELALSWTGPTGAVYVIEHRSQLGSGVGWQPIDVTSLEQAVNKWTAPLDTLGENAGFFRLATPQPAIFSVEPARFAFGGTVELYVVGQCFGTNTDLRVGPLTLTNRIIVNPNLMQVSFVPPSAGTYVFDLVATDNNVVSSFAVECFDPLSPPTSVLQGPPEEPWAAPHFKEVTGLDVYIDCLEIQEGGVNSGAHKVKEKANRTKCGNNLRVMPSGEVELDEVDMIIPGRGLDFVWGRKYRSLSGPNTAQGNRWDFSYNISVRQVAGGIEVRDGMGRVDLLRSDNGFGPVYGADGLFYIGQFSNSLFRLTFPDTGYWEFEHPGGAVGKLIHIVDRNNNTMRLEYDGMGRLERVIDTLNRTNTIAYSPVNGKIASLTDFTGRRVTYAYYRVGDQGGNDGDLRSVTSPPVIGTPNRNDFPAGKTTTYTYTRGFQDPRQNSLLQAIIDAKGQIAHRHVYQHNQTDLEFLRCIGQQVGTTNDRLTFAYLPQTPSPANRYATMKVIINDRVGNVSEHLFDALLRELQTREFTGRAVPGLRVSDSTNRPAAKLRVDDPDYFETRYEWNADSLCTRVTHPRGNVTEMVYQRAFNQNSSRSNNAKRHDADLRVLRERACCGGADTDGDGTADLDQITKRFEHDARFGAGLAFKSSAKVITDRDTGRSKGFGFITSATDPRGTVTTAQYDTQGNRVKVHFYWDRTGSADNDFAYNTHGQLTGITNASDSEGCRRVDAFEYYDDPAMPGFGYLKKSTKDKGGFLCGTTDHFLIDTTYEYDARGNVTRVIDPRGFDTVTTYNALDQPTTRQTQQSSFGTLVRTTTFLSYDSNDNLVQVDVENRDHNDVLDVVNPYWTSFAEYDLLDRQTLIGHELTHVVQGPRNGTNRFFYDGNGNMTLAQSAEAVNGNDPNNVVAYQYDERDLPFQVLPAPGTGLAAVDRFDYDQNGNCKKVSKVDAFSIKQKTFVHDGFDRRVGVTDAMGNVATWAYDRNDNLVYERLDGELTDVPGSAANRRLSEARYEYDLLNRLTRFRPAFFDVFTELAIGDGEATTSFIYAPNSQLMAETDDNGHTTSYAYDTAGRLARMTDAKADVVQYAYDACGNPTNTTSIERSDAILGGSEQRFSTTSEYDGRGRLTRSTDNVGNGDQYFYDSRNNLVRHFDPRGNLTGFTYDGLSRQTLVIADLNGDDLLDYAADIGSASSYNDNSRLVSTTDDNGNVTRYAYDALNRPVAQTNADNTVIRLVWSPRSNLILYGDANGTVISNSYDLLDRCVRRDIAPAAGVATTTTLETFTYDGESRLVQAAASPSGVQHSFVWNSLSDLSEQSSGGLTLRATHDGVGNRTSLRCPSSVTVGLTYDALNQVTSRTRCEGCGNPWLGDLIDSIAYEGPGRPGRIARPNGINTRINWNGLQNPPNQPGDSGWKQVVRVNHARAMGGGSIDTRIAAYDRTQNKILRAQTASFSTGGDMQTNTFGYDPVNRMQLNAIGRTGTISTRSFVLDGNGNRQQVITDGAVETYQMNNALSEPADFQMNQYSLTPFGGQHYDRNGNLISRVGPAGGTYFQYDYADRLVRVDRDVVQTTVQIAAYAYDALGRRVSKTVFPPAPMAPVTTSWFLDADCDGDGIVEEYENGALRKVLPTPRTTTRVDSWASIFERVSGVTLDGGGKPTYLLGDELGNVLALTDANGSVLERYEYEDYGLPQFLDAKGIPLVDGAGLPVTSSPMGNPFLFHNMEWDAETGFYHARAGGENPLFEGGGMSGHNPLYEPKAGRYTSRDMGNNRNWDFLGGGSLSFCGDNPWSGGGGGGGSMRAGISTSRSNLRTKNGLISSDNGDGGGGNSMRAGISTSRSNLRTKNGLISRDDGDDDGGNSMRAGISTSRSNLRAKGKFASDDKVEVMFNPREYSVRKVTVRGWNPEKKEEIIGSALKKEEGGRHTPFHNKYRPQFALGNDVYIDCLEIQEGGCNRLYGPGQAHWGSARLINPVAMDKGLRGYRARGVTKISAITMRFPKAAMGAIAGALAHPGSGGRDKNMTDIICKKF